MIKLHKFALFALFAVSFYILPDSCLGDLLFIHDFKSKEYLSGTHDAQLFTGFTSQAMYIDKRVKYTGSWMTRFFGKVKEQRDTTHFLLDKNQIHEIDWNKGEVLIFPFEKLNNIRWVKEKRQFMEQADYIIKARYETVKPDLQIRIVPGKHMIKDYECIHVQADLRLETKDLKKNASSITNIQQQLWVSDTVPGFDQYEDFNKKLSDKLGFEAKRLGMLNVLLRYWDGPLDSILEPLKDVRGYPVQSIVSIMATYIKNTDSDSPETISKEIKKETMTLTQVQVVDSLDINHFKVNIPVKYVTVE